MRRDWDVIVIGAGPAGLATALMLRRQSERQVLVLDTGAARRERFGESTAPEIQVPLHQLGLLESFRAGPHLPYPGSLSIWAGTTAAPNDAIYSPMGPPWRLERARFDAMLQDAAVAAGVALHWHTRWQGLGREDGRLRLAVQGPSLRGELRADWIVDASGAAARFAHSQGARRQSHDRLFALARYSPFEGPAPTWQTLLEATDLGWFYAARLPDQRIVVLFVGEAETVAAYRERDHQGFARALAATRLIAPKFGQLVLSGTSYEATAIQSGCLDKVCGPGWLACGDAAASYDPIVARGMTKALEDGIAAAAHISGRLVGEAYQRRNDERFQDYRAARAQLYRQAQRSTAFWQRRN